MNDHSTTPAHNVTLFTLCLKNGIIRHSFGGARNKEAVFCVKHPLTNRKNRT